MPASKSTREKPAKLPPPDPGRSSAHSEGDCAELSDTAAAHCAQDVAANSDWRPLAHPPLRLLLACHDPSLREVLRPLFDSLGPTLVVEANDTRELDDLLSRGGPYELIISQAVLSGSRGLEVLAKARERGDNTPFVLVESLRQNFVRLTLGGGSHSVVSTRLVNTVALVDLLRQLISAGKSTRIALRSGR